MYKHILIPTDGSDLANDATDRTLALASELGARVTVLTVIEPPDMSWIAADQFEPFRATYERNAAEKTAALLTEAARRAEALGVPCQTVSVESDAPYEAIIAAATSRGCDLIAMASHGRRGVAAIVFGSQTLQLLTHSRIPVLVYR